MASYWPVIDDYAKCLLVLLAMVQLPACSSGSSESSGVVNGEIPEDAVPENTVIEEFSLVWTAPSEREDGTPLPLSEISGYRIYYGAEEGDHTGVIDVSDSSSFGANLSFLAPGIYYVVVTTVDTNELESRTSNEISLAIQ